MTAVIFYSLKLLRTFYAEGLVDNRTFLTWLMQQMSTCNLAQAGFVARLADEYLDGLLHSRALTRPFVEACLSKFMEVCGNSPVAKVTSKSFQIRSTSTQDYLVTLESLLRSLLQVRFPTTVLRSALTPPCNCRGLVSPYQTRLYLLRCGRCMGLCCGRFCPPESLNLHQR